MAQSIAFTIDRASKSTAVANTFLAAWTWDEKTPTQHDAMRIALEAKLSTAGAAEANMLSARAALDTALEEHHVETKQGISLARVRHRNDAGKLATLTTLTFKGDSRTRMREEARKWLAWWAEFDAAWVPVPGVTLAAFTARHAQIEGTDVPTLAPGLVDLYDVATALSRAAAEAVNEDARVLEDVNQAWYRAATSVFPEGTAEGDLIRGQVPTTYDPANPPLPAPGQPQGVGAATGAAQGEVDVVWVATPFAAYYFIALTNANGDPIPGPEQTSTTAFHLTGLSTGETISLTISAGNLTGTSVPSEPVSVVVG